MGGYPQNPRGNRPTPAGWTGEVADTASPAGGNGPGSSQPYARRDPDEGSWFWGAVHGSEHFAESAYHAASGVVHDAEETALRVAHVAEAIYLASDYASDAVRDKIRMDVQELKRAFIPGLVMSLGILAITTLAGATVAGILVGVLTAGAGAVPAAVAGGELGLDAGFLILDAMGIGFLLREVFAGISQVFTMVKAAMEIAWNAGSNPKRPPMTDIETAANGLAAAVAEMVNLLLEGVLIWILAESAVARAGKLAKGVGKLSNPAALASRGSQVLSELRAKPAEMRATLREGVSELAGVLRRAGQLTRGLADFIEAKFEQILKNVTEDAGKQAEELKRTGGGGGGETDGGNVGKSSPPKKSTPAKAAAGKLSGRRIEIPPKSDPATTRSLMRENDSADALVDKGYNVEQNPLVEGPKNPDYRINGEIYDNYAPSTGNVRNIASEIEGKVSSGQTTNVVVNLADSPATPAALQSQLSKYPIEGLNNVIVIDQSGALTLLKGN